MLDPLAIGALVISAFSAIFVAIKEGIGLTLEYRESEVTVRKKREIDEKLDQRAKEKLKEFTNVCGPKKEIDEETIKKAVETGYEAYLSRDVTGNILDGLTYYAKRSLRNIGIACYFLFFAIVLGLYFWDISTLQSILLIAVLGSATVAYFAFAYATLKKHYFLRERFALLHENPTMEYCKELVDELIEKDLW